MKKWRWGSFISATNSPKACWQDGEEIHRCRDWLTVLHPHPLGRVDLGGRHQRGHHRQPALWPSTAHQPLPAGQSAPVLPSAVLLCRWNTTELPAHRWQPHYLFKTTSTYINSLSSLRLAIKSFMEREYCSSGVSVKKKEGNCHFLKL